ncbi:DnaA/Hda family protein [Ferrovibrio sp.]|uniref:HdaA/DnaA family protein n=1 Tax=Ferrovibrio sp. TaxID=1917215 RepID=UPI000CB0742C|nr:DnaA/Hda family protein [Ferrovibrio sp.]PJI43339.1 MAG: chromosomal replication initiator DnaA [Ferrovibrio sp.]
MVRNQLSLGLALPTSWAREDFLEVPGNAAALAAAEGEAQPALALYGPPGSGKTHLARIWTANHAARLIGPADLSSAAVDQLAQQPLAVDDADRTADPVALFHLVNLMRERRHALLLTGSAAPAHWSYTLPDLMSRLKAMPAERIAEPDDTLLSAVLVKLFADRQLQVSEDVVKYLAARIERSCRAAREWVAVLDAAALAENRAVTVALARRLLEENQASD